MHYREEIISQIPALQLLINMGYQYLSPEEALAMRDNKYNNVLLEPILKAQLAKINRIHYRGKDYAFSEENINAAVIALKELRTHEGFMAVNQQVYDLLTLGKTFEQTIGSSKKSYSFRYIDWECPENNVYHVSEEFVVTRTARNDHYRPDIVLFINGIPIVVIECKSNVIKNPITEAISQHLRNQKDDGIRELYQYSQLLLALAVNSASYATTATPLKYWQVWRELFGDRLAENKANQQLKALKNRPLPADEQSALFAHRYQSTQYFFRQQATEEVLLTEQDLTLYYLCRKERLLRLVQHYTIFDNHIKKIARYQQFFAVEDTLAKVKHIEDGKRLGGVIWHTQGSGKSLTMVMLAQLLAADKSIKHPKILLVTDRTDLDDQISKTFKKCNLPVEKAATGTRLTELLKEHSDKVITTTIHKFETVVSQLNKVLTSSEIFVLIDEAHRTQYGRLGVKMQQVFPKACFIAFTGTPLMKKEKNTAAKFGGIIGTPYTITDAVADGAIVPILYEGRHNLFDLNEKPLDNYFDRVSEPLSDYGKAHLKRKANSIAQLNRADQIIQARAWDIAEHFKNNVQNEGFKAMLVTPSKTAAIDYRDYLMKECKLDCEVLISAPDTRENNEDSFEENEYKVGSFYKAMMDKYGSSKKYEDSLIDSFRDKEQPELLIVVDKLLTGFDAPIVKVMYLTRSLKEHSLLQAIARVNRVKEGKDYGLIIDYYGNLENLDKAIEMYGSWEDFEADDLKDTVTNATKEIEKLPQLHSQLWDIFKTVKNKYDTEAYAELLSDKEKRETFYERLSLFARMLKLALSLVSFDTEENAPTIERYQKDLKFFLALRTDVARRYFDTIDYTEYEKQIQKLIDKHIITDGDFLQITEKIDLFDKEERDKALEQLTGHASKADHIASRTVKAISIKMDEDPIFYQKLSTLIRQTIEAYRQKRIDELEYFNRVRDYENQFFEGAQSDLPEALIGNKKATAFYNLLGEHLKTLDTLPHTAQKVKWALQLDLLINHIIYEEGTPIVDWQQNSLLVNEIAQTIDDYFYQLKHQQEVEIPFDIVDTIIEEIVKVSKQIG
ncbi:HsdR family type I site-specific deoxyribonuclease [Capnocytophaga sputigena]|uniref:type I restriction endonuclease subunit R n=1 Tax=Capnocytophaga sputigena TaxID=1019 RepID=UPI0028D163E8|nr:HsdR family type I site-specific deoxyribonuclease [Capnocytophaga sputigena]